MRYPSEWLEELRTRTDIVSVVSEYVMLKQRGRRYTGLCPFHNEKTPSFSVDPDQGLYYCFGCKAGGSVFQFVMDAERMEFSEAVRYLADKARMPLPEKGEDEAHARAARSLREAIYAANQQAARIFHETLYAPDGARVLDYLYSRGLDDPAIRRFGLGAAPSGWDALTKRLTQSGVPLETLVSAGLTLTKEGRTFDMFRGRAIFPIIDAHGRVLAFGGRAMGDAEPKYLNTADTPAFNKRQNVYAANLLKKTRGLERVLLVEGYMDVVSLVGHGVQGACATLGTALTPEQAKLMKRYAPEICIAYDGDSAGQNATLRALDILDSMDIPGRVLIIPGGKDPDEFIRQEGRQAFESLAPMTGPQYRMLRAEDGLDLGTEEGRAQYAIAAAAIIRAVRQPVEQENLLKRLMLKSGFPREVLIQQIGMAPPPRPQVASAEKRRTAQRSAESVRADAIPDYIRAERTLLSLLAARLVAGDLIDVQHFSGEGHRAIGEMLLAGTSPAEMLDGVTDDAQRRTMLEIFQDPPALRGDEVTDVITDCMRRIQRHYIDERIAALTERLQVLEGDEKRQAMIEITRLTKEKDRH